MSEDAGFIDACVHPHFHNNDELRHYLKEPFKSRGIPSVEKDWYQAPDGEYARALTEDRAYPGSEPEVVRRDLFERGGASFAVLVPLTRGNNPDRHLGTAICAAVNDWLAERWLDTGNLHGRFRGTIRINPEDPAGAVREIERWADHPLMVQVGVPLESREPYGKPQFRPIWEAAARHRLPVAVHSDGGAGIDFPPTAAGYPRTFVAYAVLTPLNYWYHLANMLAEGVFEELADLVFVLGDGGAGMLTPLMWRYDTFWRPFRDITPWSPRLGSEYLRDHVRFCTDKLDGAPDATTAAAWFDLHGLSHLVMFGSGYPRWSMGALTDLPAGLRPDQIERIRYGNAAHLYATPGRVRETLR